MKKAKIVVLLLSAALLLSGLFAGTEGLKRERLPLPGRVWAYCAEEVADGDTPGMLLVYGTLSERIRCAGLTLELARRGYRCVCIPAGRAGDAWEPITELCGVYGDSVGLLAAGSGRSAAAALGEAAADLPNRPGAVFFLGGSAAAESSDALRNVLCLYPGEAPEAQPLTGVFAEGTARKTVVLPKSGFLRAAVPELVEWAGKTLTRPRDGAYAPDEQRWPLCAALFCAGAVCSFAGAVLPVRKKADNT